MVAVTTLNERHRHKVDANPFARLLHGSEESVTLDGVSISNIKWKSHRPPEWSGTNDLVVDREVPREVRRPSPSAVAVPTAFQQVLIALFFQWGVKSLQQQLASSRESERRARACIASLDKAATRLQYLANLGNNWDSYGAVSPTGSAIATAHLFLQELATLSITREKPFPSPWAIMPIPDGGVQFHWRTTQLEIELECFPDGGLYYFIEVDGTTESESDENSSASMDSAVSAIFAALG